MGYSEEEMRNPKERNESRSLMMSVAENASLEKLSKGHHDLKERLRGNFGYPKDVN